jgi:serine/threonine-protein kinase PknG
VRARDPHDWRTTWLAGRAALEAGRVDEARKAFEAVVAELPGELAPKLALGICHEMSGSLDRAQAYYDHVSRIDPSLTAAAFGLGRILLKLKARPGAVEAYRRVPATSSRYPQALIAIARALLDTSVGPIGREEILGAGEAVDTLRALLGDAREVQELAADVCRAAIPELESGRVTRDARERLFGRATLTPASLRAEAERALRACAKFAPSFGERLKVVDAANAIRPLTLI